MLHILYDLLIQQLSMENHEQRAMRISSQIHGDDSNLHVHDDSPVGKHLNGLRSICMWLLALIVIGLSAYLNFHLYSNYQRWQLGVTQFINQTIYTVQDIQRRQQNNKITLADQIQNERSNLQLEIAELARRTDGVQNLINEINFTRQEHIQFLTDEREKIHRMIKNNSDIIGQYYDLIIKYESIMLKKDAPFLGDLESQAGTLQHRPDFEPIVWFFVENYSQDQNYLRRLYLNNIIHFSKISNFDLRLINYNNYFYYLSPSSVTLLANLFAELEQRIGNHEASNLGDHINTIRRVIIMMHILQQNGGTIIIDTLSLVEPLDWIYDISRLKFVNFGNGGLQPKIISFFNRWYSSGRGSYLRMGRSGTEQEMVLFPNIDRCMITAVKQCQFIKQMNKQMIRILKDPFNIKRQIDNTGYDMGQIKGEDPYYEFFFIAGHIVLQNKQKELDKISIEKSMIKAFAIDYYGLYSINAYNGPLKLKSYFDGESQEYMMSLLARTEQNELETKIGKIRYVNIFDNFDLMNKKLLEIRDSKVPCLLKNSFIQKTLFPNVDKQAFVYKRNYTFGESMIGKQMKWKGLPKKLWLYSSSNSSKWVQKAMIRKIKKQNEHLGLQIYEIGPHNIKQYISSDVQNDVAQILALSKHNNTRLRELVYILCVLSRHGGIYINSSYIVLDDFSWLYQVRKLPHNLIVNRHGTLPKLFMFYNLRQRKGSNFTYQEELDALVDPMLVYDDGFIAVDQDSEFMDEWTEFLLGVIAKGERQLSKIFQKHVSPNLFIFNKSIDLLPIEVLRFLYVRGQQKYQNTKKLNIIGAENPYRIWAIDGDFSLYKISKNTNYENTMNLEHYITAKYRVAEAIESVGTFFKIVRIDKENIDYLQSLVQRGGSASLQYIHPDSLFYKYVLYNNNFF